jgi:methylmalonyl-CoA mutase
VDNVSVRQQQEKRLVALRAGRDAGQLEATLVALVAAAESGEGNLLSLSVQAMRARATVGEVSEALAKVFGRHEPKEATVSGVYGGAMAGDEHFQRVRAEVERFAQVHGRRPRLLVAKLGQDGHDRGARVIAAGFADLGFDVDVAPLFQTPEEVARQAIDNDVHVVGVSTQAGGHLTLLPELVTELAQRGASEVAVVCGGVIPPQDYPALQQAGVKAVFGPGTSIATAAEQVLGLLDG